MKTKSVYLFIGMFLLSALVGLTAIAQQQKNVVPAKNLPDAGMSNPAAAVYTYRVFQAPNKMYGYDIFQNDKGIFHQPPSIVQSANPALAKANPPNSPFYEKQTPQNIIFLKKEDAQNAALLSIEKIKKQMPPTLTEEEIKKIIP